MKTRTQEIKEDIYRYNQATQEILNSYVSNTGEDPVEIMQYIWAQVDPHNTKEPLTAYKEAYLLTKEMLTI